MKKRLTLATATVLMLLSANTSQAHVYDRDDSDYWLRYVAYALHPIGVIVETLVLKPIHYVVSYSPATNDFFGHYPGPSEHWDHRDSVVVKTDVAIDDSGGPGEKPLPPLTTLKDMSVVYFDYDKSDIRGDQMERVEKDLQFLKAHPDARVVLEGHCDERGTIEYNYSLGERRAQTVHKYFTTNGIDASRISLVSKGEAEPAAAGKDESAYALNRRVEFKEKP